MHRLIETILKKRMPAAPALFVASQVSRLHEALLVSHNAMSGAKAADRVVKIARELACYHGVEPPAPAGKPKPRKLVAPPPLALAGPESGRTRMAPQAIEKARFADANGNAQPHPVEEAAANSD